MFPDSVFWYPYDWASSVATNSSSFFTSISFFATCSLFLKKELKHVRKRLISFLKLIKCFMVSTLKYLQTNWPIWNQYFSYCTLDVVCHVPFGTVAIFKTNSCNYLHDYQSTKAKHCEPRDEVGLSKINWTLSGALNRCHRKLGFGEVRLNKS